MRLQGTKYGYLVALASAAGEGGVGVLMPPYLTDLGHGAPLVGVFVGFYAVANLLSRWPGGRWYRIGLVRPLIVASLVVIGVANVLFAFTQDILALGALRILGGLAFGLGTTVNLAMFIDSLPPAQSRERAMSLYTAALAGGFMCGNFAGGLGSERWGYPGGFLLVAVPPLLAILLTPFAREPSTIRAARAGGSGLGGVLRAIREPLLLLVLTEAFLLHFLFGLHYAYSALYFLAAGATLGNLGVMRGLFSGTQVVSRLGSSGLFSRFGYRPVAVGALAAQVLFLVLIPTTDNLLVLTALSMAYGASRGVMMVANTLGLAQASDRSAVGRGTASGLFNASQDLGILLGGPLSGAVVTLVGLGQMFVWAPIGVLLVHWLSLWLNGRRVQALDAGPAD